jgi:hypothetical protein
MKEFIYQINSLSDIHISRLHFFTLMSNKYPVFFNIISLFVKNFNESIVAKPYQAKFRILQGSILRSELVVEMEGQNDPEDCARSPDESGLSEAERELGQIRVPGQVRIPERVVAAQALESVRTVFFLHGVG